MVLPPLAHLETNDMMVIIGCGNLNRCDDGVGVIVARRLAAAAEDPTGRVRIFDAGTIAASPSWKASSRQRPIAAAAASKRRPQELAAGLLTPSRIIAAMVSTGLARRNS